MTLCSVCRVYGKIQFGKAMLLRCRMYLNVQEILSTSSQLQQLGSIALPSKRDLGSVCFHYAL